MSKSLRALAVLSALTSAGCATSYYSEGRGLTGGGFRYPGPGKLVKVGFDGNSGVAASTAANYTLFRAAEYAQAHRKPWFVMYQSLGDALADRPAHSALVGQPLEAPGAFVYVLLLDESRPKARRTVEVLAEMKAAGLKSSVASRPEATTQGDCTLIDRNFPFAGGEATSSLRIVDSCPVQVCRDGLVDDVGTKRGTQLATIPAGKRITISRELRAERTSGNRRTVWTCTPGVSFTPTPGERYVVDVNVVGKGCSIQLLREDGTEPIGMTVEKSAGPRDCVKDVKRQEARQEREGHPTL